MGGHSERGWLYPESQSRAGTFPTCHFAAFVLWDQVRANYTLVCKPGRESHTIAPKDDILAQVTIVKQLPCTRDCAHILPTLSCFILPLGMKLEPLSAPFPFEDTEAQRGLMRLQR